MAIKRIFYVTTNSLTILLCDKSSVRVDRTFSMDEDGRRSFAIALQSKIGLKSAFLVDFVEEEFRVERVAHVVGVDRVQYLRRKAKSLFNVEQLTAVQIIGRDQAGRRDDVGVFYSLNRSDVIERWLDEVRAAKVPLAGIFSAPMMSAILLKRLKIIDEHVLLVTFHGGQYIRQSFLSAGKLKLSRLSPFEWQAVDFVDQVLEEIQRNRAYLLRVGLLARDQKVKVCVLVPDGFFAVMEATFAKLVSDEVIFEIVPISELGELLKLKKIDNRIFAESYLARLLYEQIPVVNYADGKEKIYLHLYLVRQLLIYFGLMIAFVGLLWATLDVYDAYMLGQEQSVVQQKKQKVENDTSVELRIAENHGQENTLLMRETVELHQALIQNKPNAFLTPSVLGAMMTHYPNIQIDNMKWEVAPPADPAAMAMGGGMPPDPAVAGGGTPDAVWQMMKLDLKLKQTPARYADIFQQIETFRAELASKTLVIDATVTSFPIDVQDGSQLKGSSKLGQVSDQPVKFSIEVKFKKEQNDGIQN